MATNPDAVIIGGGIIGACTALELARAGLSVTVIEKHSVGGGSTAASSAVIRQCYSQPEAILLARDSLEVWGRWAEAVEVPGGEPAAAFLRAGVVFLLVDGFPAAQHAEVMRACQVEVDLLSPAELAARFPGWNDEGVFAALHERNGGYVDQPDLAAINAMDAARRLGAEVVIDRVTGIDVAGDSVTGVQLAREGTISTRAVICAAGPWSCHVNRMAGVDLPLFPERHRTIQVPTFGGTEGARAIPVVADLPGLVYWRPDPAQGGLHVGTLNDDIDGEPIDDPDDFDPTVDRPYYEGKNITVAQRMPDSVGIGSRAPGIAGVYDVHGPDRYPIFGATAVDGYFVAAGTSGAWFKGGPSIGALMRHVVTGASGPFVLPSLGCELDVSFFRPDRAPITTAFGSGVIG